MPVDTIPEMVLRRAHTDAVSKACVPLTLDIVTYRECAQVGELERYP